MSEREKLLGRCTDVRLCSLVEVIEYLDCHPHNEAALKYYREMRAAFDKASSEYEDAFGPLTAREVDVRGGHWTGSMIRGRGKERITDVVLR